MITKEITDRKIAQCWWTESCFFFGEIESTLSWHHPQHLLKHPCSVALPGRLPPAPPSVSPALLLLLPKAGSAESALKSSRPASLLPGAQALLTGGRSPVLGSGLSPSQHCWCRGPPGLPPGGLSNPLLTVRALPCLLPHLSVLPSFTHPASIYCVSATVLGTRHTTENKRQSLPT